MANITDLLPKRNYIPTEDDKNLALEHILHLLGIEELEKMVIVKLMFHRSNRKRGFSVSDKTLAYSDSKSDGDIRNAQDRFRRRRKKLIEWQKKTKIILVEYVPGNKVGSKYNKSKYILPVCAWCEEVVRRASRTRLWIDNANKALENAAMEYLKEKIGPAKIIQIAEHRKKRDMQARMDHHALMVVKLSRAHPELVKPTDILSVLFDVKKNA